MPEPIDRDSAWELFRHWLAHKLRMNGVISVSVALPAADKAGPLQRECFRAELCPGCGEVSHIAPEAYCETCNGMAQVVTVWDYGMKVECKCGQEISTHPPTLEERFAVRTVVRKAYAATLNRIACPR